MTSTVKPSDWLSFRHGLRYTLRQGYGCQRMLHRSKKALEDEVGEGEKTSVILVPQMIESCNLQIRKFPYF